MSNGKAMIILLIVGLMKKILLYKMSYFLGNVFSKNHIKVQLDLFNYTTKSYFKNAAGINASKYVEKVDLLRLKIKTDKLDIGKLETTSADLSKLENVVKNEVVKETEYNELAKRINAIQTTDTSILINITGYDTKVGVTEKKYLSMINNLTAVNFAARLSQTKLTIKSDIADF